MRQERILSTSCLRILDIGPSAQKVPMGHDAGELPGDGTVNGFSDVEVCGEENVKVALVNLYYSCLVIDLFFLLSKKAGLLTYKGSRDGHHFSLEPGLHDGSVETLDGLRERVEIRGNEAVGGEVLFQDVEELHQSGGDELGLGQVGGEGHLVGHVPKNRVGRVRLGILPSRGGMANAEESRGEGVQLVDVEFVKVAVAVDEHVALERLLGGDVVADAVVGEVVKDLHGEEEARRGDVLVPLEDGLVDDFDLVCMAARFGGGEEVAVLEGRKRGGDFDDVEFSAGVDLRVGGADVVEDVEHEGAASGAHFEDEQVVVGIRGQAVVGDEVARNGLAVEGPEELCRGVPELSCCAFAFLFVEEVFEFGVSPAEVGLEFQLVAHGIEVEGLAWAEDDGFFGEVAV